MKVLGAGGVLTALGGATMASSGDGADESLPDAGSGSARAGVDRDALDQHGAGTVYDVQTLIAAPPTNPNRPADFFYQPTGLHVQPGDVVRFVFVTPDHNVVFYHPAFGMRRRVPTGVTAFSTPVSGWTPESIPGDMIDPPGPPGTGEGETATGTADGTGTATETATSTETETPAGTGTQTGTGTPGGGPSGDGPVPDTRLYTFQQEGVYDMLCSPHETFGMAMRVVVGDVTEAPFETSDPEALPEPRTGPVGLARVTLTDPALSPANVVEQDTVAWESLAATGSDGTPTEGDGGRRNAD